MSNRGPFQGHDEVQGYWNNSGDEMKGRSGCNKSGDSAEKANIMGRYNDVLPSVLHKVREESIIARFAVLALGKQVSEVV